MAVYFVLHSEQNNFGAAARRLCSGSTGSTSKHCYNHKTKDKNIFMITFMTTFRLQFVLFFIGFLSQAVFIEKQVF